MTDHCIIVIDPQKDFTTEDGAYAKRHTLIHEIKKATARIQQLIDAQKDIGIIVVYSSYKEKQFGEDLSMCIPGTEGHELGIILSPDITILSKTKHSPFPDDVFSGYLQQRGYKHLYLCGFLAEYCVKQTALDALKNGYTVSLIEDCIATGDDVLFKYSDTITELKSAGIQVIRSASL